ncbi:MAG: exosortase A [Sphingomonadaceae bacterium]
MQPDASHHHHSWSDRVTSIPASWGRPLLSLGIVWAAILLLTASEWSEMAGQWWNSSTYNHVLLVPAIIVWLVWNRRHEIARITPQGWWPGLIATFLALLLWLTGALSGVNLAAGLGAVLALQGAVAALLGPRIVAALLFPLFYMIFLVPFGDELVPALQMVTAHIVVVLVEWSGIPAVIDGVFIDTPAGLFEVAEACSGVKFLIAMIALGSLVANCCFTRWSRRIVFMGVALLLPIIANGIRAWGTIYIAQSQGIAFAAGFDHIFYGWVFFALVIIALFAISWRYFDRSPDDPAIDVAEINRSPLLNWLAQAEISGKSAVICLCLMVPGFAVWAMAAQRLEARLPDRMALPDIPGWEKVDAAPDPAWHPQAEGADTRLLGHYRNQQGHQVDVFLAVYRSQGEGREATAYGQGAFDPGSAWRWLAPAPSGALSSGEWLLANGSVKRIAYTSYHSPGLTTGSAARFKLHVMKNRLLLRREPSMMLILSSTEQAGQDAGETAGQLQIAIGDRGQWIDRIAGLR